MAAIHRVRPTFFVYDMLAKGYAIVGVNLRGSACSSDSWELFNLQQAQDGAFAVDWLAQRHWANGKVAMYGYSYAGIMQLWVASMQPKHLVAVGPGMPVVDTYRDIGFPGGILNAAFPPAWGAGLNADWAIAYRDALQIGDNKCLQHGALHAAQNNLNSLAVQIPQHPNDDAWHHAHSIKNWVSNINVPVFATRPGKMNKQGAEVLTSTTNWIPTKPGSSPAMATTPYISIPTASWPNFNRFMITS